MQKKKILLFSIPNDGHLNILKKMVKHYGKKYDFQLVIIGRKNTRPDLKSLPIQSHILKKSYLFKNTPTTSVFDRVCELLDECLTITNEYKPDLIIYDFPAIEGFFVGEILKIPYWSSIPGMIGPFIHQDYLKKSLSTNVNRQAIAKIEEKYGFKLKEDSIEIISNCLHIPGKKNILWSYPSITPGNFMNNRQKLPYVFVGYLVDKKLQNKKKDKNKNVVYFSLGTEVMDNLWVNQAKTREGIKKVVSNLTQLWKDKQMKIIYVTQGKKVLKEYPDNWHVTHKVNQQEILSDSDLFITHGGSNSFHESMVLKVPMVFIPFFGDQPLVSNRAEQLGIGINLVKNDGIDKKKKKNFLSEKLVRDLDKAVTKILHNKESRKQYEKNLNQLNLERTPLETLIEKSV